MHSQDEQLEGVGYTVGNLRQQAREMGDELEDQAM
jgi:t-SNARE syntaxin family protein